MSDPTQGSMAVTPPVEQPTVPATTAGPDAGLPATERKEKPRGLLGDAWRDLRRMPLFWISAFFIVVLLVMAAFPQLFTSVDPKHGVLSRSLGKPSADAWFGYDVQGRDVYARVIHGAKASIIVAALSTIGTVLIGGAIGVFAGFRGGFFDTLLSRIGDIFFGLPFVLGAIVILSTFNGPDNRKGEAGIIALVIASLVVLSWPVSMRLMRSAVLANKEADYIMAARAMGAGPRRIIFKHLLPNSLAPMLVYATILVGSFIGAEATLSFLGVGLQTPVVSWGVMISESRTFIRVAPNLLLFPAGFLVVAVLSFVMLGEAVREALDPKLR